MASPANRGLIYVTVIAVVMALISAANSILYTNHVQHQAQRQWCALMTTMDKTYRDNPPLTSVGRQIAQDIHQLVIQFGCDQK